MAAGSYGNDGKQSIRQGHVKAELLLTDKNEWEEVADNPYDTENQLQGLYVYSRKLEKGFIYCNHFVVGDFRQDGRFRR